ncbi:MAG: hypothetical protein NTV09_03520 [Bacteroidetes bacterium]|nr:hypothetical protein [Bacteroidota bacterium]
MIRYLSHSEIDPEKWDATIDASYNGMVYAKSWYLNIVSPGWQALVEDEYQSVFPLTSRKKYGLSYLHQPFFTQQLGAFGRETMTASKVEKYISAIPESFRLIEIQLNHENKISLPDFKISERLTHHLDLNRPYESIYKNYSENLKRNLKRAQQNSLSIVNDFETGMLINLFKSNRGKDLATLKEKDYATLVKLVAEGSKGNLITRLGIQQDDKLEAGAIFIRSNKEYIFLFSATGVKAKETGAMTLIIDHFIKTHSPEAMNLDFEGSMDAGLARFYKSFGSKEIVYLQIRKNKLPLPIRWLK